MFISSLIPKSQFRKSLPQSTCMCGQLRWVGWHFTVCWLKLIGQQGWPWIQQLPWWVWVPVNTVRKNWALNSPPSIREMLQINRTLKVTLLSRQFSPQVFSQGCLYICIGTGQMSSFIYIDMKPKSWRFEMAFNIANGTRTQSSHPAEINRQEKAIWP